MRSSIIGCLAAMLLLASTDSSSTEQDTEELQVSGPYTHASGMVFPETVGVFQRMNVVHFLKEEHNNSVFYASLTTFGLIAVTIYVYPSHNVPLDAHFNTIVDDVSAILHKRPQTQGAHVVRQKGVDLAGKNASWELESGFPGGTGEPLTSSLLLFRRGVWFVKYRFTRVPQADPSARESFKTLVASLLLPAP